MKGAGVIAALAVIISTTLSTGTEGGVNGNSTGGIGLGVKNTNPVYIINRMGLKVLTLISGTVDVEVKDGKRKEYQTWMLEPNGSGWFYIVPEHDTTWVLGTGNGISGTHLLSSTRKPEDANSQLFMYLEERFIASKVNPNLVLEVKSGNSADRWADVTMSYRKFGYHSDQAFDIISADGSESPSDLIARLSPTTSSTTTTSTTTKKPPTTTDPFGPKGSLYFIVSELNGKVITAMGSSPGSSIKMWAKGGKPKKYQTWRIEYASGKYSSYCHIVSAMNRKLVMDVGNAKEGDQPELWYRRRNAHNQLFISSGSGFISGRFNTKERISLVIDIEYKNKKNGALLILSPRDFPRAKFLGQRWKFVPA